MNANVIDNVIAIDEDVKIGEVLVLLDWENILYSLLGLGPYEMDLAKRINALMEWIKHDIGDIFDGYVFAPEHFTAYHRKICVQNNLEIMICPKRKAKEKGAKEEDTVDEKLIKFGKKMLKHPDIKIICLVSGDEDFVPFLEKAKNKGVKIALAPPSLGSLSSSKKIIELIDLHPETGKKMVLVLSQIAV